MLYTGGAQKKSIFEDFENFEKLSKKLFFDHFGALWRLGGGGKLGFFGFLTTCFLFFGFFFDLLGFLRGGLEILAGGYGAVLGVFSKV